MDGFVQSRRESVKEERWQIVPVNPFPPRAVLSINNMIGLQQIAHLKQYGTNEVASFTSLVLHIFLDRLRNANGIFFGSLLVFVYLIWETANN